MTTFAEKPLHMIRESIAEAMKVRGVSQVELADHLGISKASVNNYLAGRRKMSVDNIEKAMMFLGLKISLKSK